MAVAAPEIGVIELASGLANLADDTAMTPDHRLPLASSTKTFVVTAVLDLVDEGALTLDDRLDQWFSDVPNAANIKIRQLLSHTSGVPDYLTPEVRMDFAVIAIERHPTGGPGFTPQELLELSSTMPPAFEPGTSFGYSNSNTVLPGGIIERVAGAPLHDVLKERLFVPNGLESFHIAGVEPAPADWGPGYTTEYSELFGGADDQAGGERTVRYLQSRQCETPPAKLLAHWPIPRRKDHQEEIERQQPELFPDHRKGRQIAAQDRVQSESDQVEREPAHRRWPVPTIPSRLAIERTGATSR